MAKIFSSVSSPGRRAKLAVTCCWFAAADGCRSPRSRRHPPPLRSFFGGAPMQKLTARSDSFSGDHREARCSRTAGVADEDDVGAQGVGSPAGGRCHALIDFLDQTGQGVARLADEDQSDQVVLASAGQRRSPGPGDEQRPEPAAIVLGADRRPGPQRFFRLQVAAHKYGDDGGTGDEASGHGDIPPGIATERTVRTLPHRRKPQAKGDSHFPNFRGLGSACR